MLKNKTKSISTRFLENSGVTRHYIPNLINNKKFQSELIEFTKEFVKNNPESLGVKKVKGIKKLKPIDKKALIMPK